MSTKDTKLTEQDVRDAFYAFTTQRLSYTEKASPETLIREFADDAGQAEQAIRQYYHGLELLKSYAVICSHRSVVGGQFSQAQEVRIVSPVIRVESGYIATSVAYRVVALAQR